VQIPGEGEYANDRAKASTKEEAHAPVVHACEKAWPACPSREGEQAVISKAGNREKGILNWSPSGTNKT